VKEGKKERRKEVTEGSEGKKKGRKMKKGRKV
jgi:hypothetical protein